jgi:hypothetical protein
MGMNMQGFQRENCCSSLVKHKSSHNRARRSENFGHARVLGASDPSILRNPGGPDSAKAAP